MTSLNNTLANQNINEYVKTDVHENGDEHLLPHSNDDFISISSDNPVLDTIDNGILTEQRNQETNNTEDQTNSESSGSTESEIEDNEHVGSFEKMLYSDSDISTGTTYFLILKFCTKYKLS